VRFVAAAFLAKNGDGPVGWRSGWLVFPASSPTFTVTGGSSRSFAGRPLVISEETACEPLSCAPLWRSAERPGHCWPSLWVCPHSFARVRAMCPSPLHRHASEASTPGMTACHPFGSEGSTLEVLFHPRGFAPPRWFPPLLELRACCIPLPILGFIRVSVPSDR